MSSAEIAFEIILPESQVADQVADLESAGGSVSDSGSRYEPRPDEAKDYTAAGFEPLTLIAGVTSAAYLLSAVHRMWRNRKSVGGTIVSVHDGTVRVRPVPAMTAGTIVVIQDSGAKIFKESEENPATTLLASVIQAVAPKSS